MVGIKTVDDERSCRVAVAWRVSKLLVRSLYVAQTLLTGIRIQLGSWPQRGRQEDQRKRREKEDVLEVDRFIKRHLFKGEGGGLSWWSVKKTRNLKS
jgi:hypothetical protein